MNKKKKKNLVIMFYALIALVLITGVSYAFFRVNFLGNREHSIQMNGLTFRYTEATQGISLVNPSVITDETGMSSSTYFDFNVYAKDTTQNYIIYLKELDSNTLTNKNIKIYLTDQSNNQILAPTLISSLMNYSEDTNSYIIHSDSITTNEATTHYYRLRMWKSEETSVEETTYQSDGNSQTGTIGGAYSFKVNVTNIPSVFFVETPQLATGMIPVYYSNGNWLKADVTNQSSEHKWYAYENKMWANVVTVTATNRATYLGANVGTPIPMSDINAMYVWIPRFNATTPSDYNGGTALAPGAIDVSFVDDTETALDAFTFGGQNLKGIWAGKFELGGTSSGCTTSNCTAADGLLIKPNINILTYHSVSQYFYEIKSMQRTGNPFGLSTDVDSHMIKNSEWGAIAYLAQSKYGRCTGSTCEEVAVNKNTSSKTGNDSYEQSLDETTTGNISGVYDMSGGSDEYVMGNYNNTIGSSGFTILPESKYLDVYDGTSYNNHTLTETSGWYSDSVTFVTSSTPWFRRGGYAGQYKNDATYTYDGIFSAKGFDGGNTYQGYGIYVMGSRAVITK